MKKITESLTSVFNWLFPSRIIVTDVLQELRVEIAHQRENANTLEKRISALEERYNSDCCFRKDCPNRVSTFKIE